MTKLLQDSVMLIISSTALKALSNALSVYPNSSLFSVYPEVSLPWYPVHLPRTRLGPINSETSARARRMSLLRKTVQY